MAAPHYRTTPDDIKTMPPGIPYIVGNEAAERFSFYGMRGILTIYMVAHLRNSAGDPAFMSDEDAKSVYHLFVASAYFFPILGSLISDILWGKYRTILILSLGYCVGHLFLALGDSGIGAGLLEPRNWLYLGLFFIALGAGGIKPCVSAHVGDQFGTNNKNLISRAFSWFYFSINIGAAASNLLTPVLLSRVGPWAAFGLPGLLMALATFVFWLGRNKFVHVPAGGKERFLAETFSPEGTRALMNLAPLFILFVPMFWSLFDQTGSAWVLQASRMDRQFVGVNWYESQVQAVNPVLILILIPTFTFVVYPFVGKFINFTPLRKIGTGLFLTVAAFGISTWIESQIEGGYAYEATSHADKEKWPANDLLDGIIESGGWTSVRLTGEKKGPTSESKAETELPQQIVFRLREYRPWIINSLTIYPYPDLSEFLAQQSQKAEPAERDAIMAIDPKSCQPRQIEVAVASAAKSKEGWTSVATATMEEGTRKPITVTFNPQEAQFVRLTILSNWGGPYVGIGEVQVHPAESSLVHNVAAIGFRPNIGWQFLAYVFLTAAEVMVSIVCLEFAYTQAPRKMKSFIMGVYFLGVSLGNLFTAAVNIFIQRPNGTTLLDGASYYWFFTIAMLITAVLYVIWSQFYRGQTYIQGEGEPLPA